MHKIVLKDVNEIVVVSSLFALSCLQYEFSKRSCILLYSFKLFLSVFYILLGLASLVGLASASGWKYPNM